ncbi:hypothetical protein [Egbenema bharatensis]|uniref:hypothetical protein n=1 Tax=Egbenema bharatensis TaxID=3463334 RepID=UPI003A8BC1CE
MLSIFDLEHLESVSESSTEQSNISGGRATSAIFATAFASGDTASASTTTRSHSLLLPLNGALSISQGRASATGTGSDSDAFADVDGYADGLITQEITVSNANNRGNRSRAQAIGKMIAITPPSRF